LPPLLSGVIDIAHMLLIERKSLKVKLLLFQYASAL